MSVDAARSSRLTTQERSAGTTRLTPKQARFVEEYLCDLNATQAAIRAGYAPKNADVTGPRLLGNVGIQHAIADGRARLTERAEVTAAWILQRLKTVAERCLVAEPVLDNEGNPTGEYRFDSSGANRSLELLGKHRGLFDPQPPPPSEDRLPMMIFVQHNELERAPAGARREVNPAGPPTLDAQATEELPVMEVPTYEAAEDADQALPVMEVPRYGAPARTRRRRTT